LWISVYNQSATVTHMPLRHCATVSDAPNFYEAAFYVLASNNSYTFLPVIPTADLQRSSGHNIGTPSAINYIIAPDKYQALWCDPQWVCFFPGIPLQITKVFSISNSRRVLNVVCFLLGCSPASEFYVPTFRNTLSVPPSHLPAYENGSVFRNVGISNSGARESARRKHTNNEV
jgi:hypothetical protein